MRFKDKIDRAWCLLRYKVFYQPKGRVLQWVLRRSILILIFLYIIAHLGIGVIFSFVYQEVGGIYEKKQEIKEVKSFWGYLHFSLTTQTTLGYGDLAPAGKARLISAAQTSIGIVLNALALGVIVTRLLRRSPRIVLPKKLAYDHKNTKYLYIQIWNREADHYIDTDITAKVTRRVILDVPPYQIFHTFPLALHIIKPDVISPNRILFVTTTSEGIDPMNPPELGEQSNKFAITSLESSDELDVAVTAVSSVRGDHVAVTRSYRVKDIECGTFSSLRPYEIEGDSGPLEYRNFGKVVATSVADCKRCEILEKCPLFQAVDCRNSNKSKNLKSL